MAARYGIPAQASTLRIASALRKCGGFKVTGHFKAMKRITRRSLISCICITTAACSAAVKPQNFESQPCDVRDVALSPDGLSIITSYSTNTAADARSDLLGELGLHATTTPVVVVEQDVRTGQSHVLRNLADEQNIIFVRGKPQAIYIDKAARNMSFADNWWTGCDGNVALLAPQVTPLNFPLRCTQSAKWPIFRGQRAELAYRLLRTAQSVRGVLTSDGLIRMLISEDVYGRPTGVISERAVAEIPDPDDISIVEPTELTNGSLGFWTDTDEEGGSHDLALFSEDGHGAFRFSRSFSSPYHDVILTREPGRLFDKLSPKPAMTLEGHQLANGTAYHQLETRIRKELHYRTAVLSIVEDQRGATTALLQYNGRKPQKLWTCSIRRPGERSFIVLNTRTFGPVWAAIYDNDGRPKPVAIVLHGGPAGNRNQPETAAIEDVSPMGFALSSAGYQMVAPNYVGSGSGSRSFRRKLDRRARDAATETVDATINWIRAASNNARYRPVIAGASYGAYLAAGAFMGGAPAAGYVFASGVYDPESQFGREASPLAFFQGSAFWSPYQALAAKRTIQKDAGLIVIASSDDRVVHVDQSTRWADALKAKGLHVTEIINEKGGHGLAPLSLMQDGKAKAALQSFQAIASPVLLSNTAE